MAELTLYTSIHKLPLARFIDAAVDNDLEQLIILGTGTKEHLEQVWEDITEQYTRAIGGSSYDYEDKLIKQITNDKATLFLIEKLVSILDRYYVPQLVAELEKIADTKIHLNIDDKEQYDQELSFCLNKCAFLKFRITNNEKELIQRREQNHSEPLTRSYFDKLLIALSDHAKFNIDENTITVGKFCERVKRFIEYCQNKSIQKRA